VLGTAIKYEWRSILLKIEIGDYELVDQVNLAIPKDECATLHFQLEQWRFPIQIRFVVTAGMSEDKELKVTSDSDVTVLEFRNWTDPFGIVTSTPARLCKLGDGRLLRFIAYHNMVGSVNVLNIYFLLLKK